MKRTPLYEAHTAAGARLVDFAGWEMPVQYAGVVEEYQAVRTAAGLFDVSHMGRVVAAGPGALAFLQHVTTNDVGTLGVLESHYSMVCNPNGGIKDDVYLYRLKQDEYLLCVNASNRDKIVAWLREQADGARGLDLRDRSTDLAQLALQGPAARAILLGLGVQRIADLKPRRGVETSIRGEAVVITRTGYTGEAGYELYLPADAALGVWNLLVTEGKAAGLKPAGLGCRDLLRLEMAYLLYGNDISEDTTPLEANAEWTVCFEKGEFIGREALVRQRQDGLRRRLVAFELLEKAVPRHGFRILRGGTSAEVIGEVTSGNLSPLLQKGIGLGYVPPVHGAPGTALAIEIRNKIVPAVVVKPPFYKRARG